MGGLIDKQGSDDTIFELFAMRRVLDSPCIIRLDGPLVSK